MNYNELIALTRWCKAIGITTLQQLARLKFQYGLKTNNQLLNRVHAWFVYQIPYEELM